MTIQDTFTIEIISGPTGKVHNNWPYIEYRLNLKQSDKVVLKDQKYSLGIGHVKWRKSWMIPIDLAPFVECIAGGKTPKDKAMTAKAAAHLAKMQKVKPKADDVVFCLLMDSQAYTDDLTFADWAGDYGYSDDSITAKNNYDACIEIGRALTRAIGRDKLTELRKKFEDY